MSELSVSVIMTVKNGKDFIEDSLRSVKAQIYAPYEMIIVDDGSSDNTCEIVERVISEFNFPVKLIRTGGIGRSAALNLALQSSSGEWVANIDADDLWCSSKLGAQVMVISKFPDADLVGTQATIFEGEGSVDIGCTGIDPCELSAHILSKRKFYFRNPIGHSSVLMRRLSLDRVSGYDEHRKMQVDYDLWVRLLKSGAVLYYTPAALVFKRVHSGQSFERRRRFFYVLSDLNIKLKSMRDLEAPVYYYPIPYIIFMLAFLPFKVRQFINRIIGY